MQRVVMFIVLVAVGWCTGTTQAQVLSAPSIVHAQPDGSFSFTAQFTAGAEPVTVAAWEWLSTTSPFPTTAPRGAGRSCDCSSQNCVLAPFSVSSFEVTGKLLRPSSAKISTHIFSTCTSMQFPQYTAQTEVLAADARPAPALPPWAALLGMQTLLVSALYILSGRRHEQQRSWRLRKSDAKAMRITTRV